MSVHDPAGDSVEVQASLWLARRRAAAAPLDQEREFQAWLAADASHADAYDRMCRVLGEVSSLTHLSSFSRPRPARRRSHVAPAAAAAAVALVGLTLGWRMLGVSRIDAATDVAEMRTIPLPDGSRITLAPKSHVRIAYGGGGRRVELSGGEAFFEVAHDPSRPFVVRAGDVVVRDIGTRFDINRSGGRLRISVLDGEVEVRAAGAGGEAAPRLLRGGQRIEAVADRNRSAGVRMRLAVAAAAAPAGAWREGRLVYDDVRLSDLVADLNRYYRPGVRLRDPRLGERRVAASFKVSEMDTFLDDLPNALPVRVDRDLEGQVQISPASR